MDEQPAPTQDEAQDVLQTQDEAPVNNEEQPSEQVAVETAAEAPAEEQAPAETPTEEPSEEEDFDLFEGIEAPQYQTPQLDWSQLPTDEAGNVDPNVLAQAINNQVAAATEAASAKARAEYLEMRKEEQLWNKATAKYPELKTDKELRDMVKNARYGAIIEGKNPTPAQIADQIFKRFGTAKTEGMKQATENVKIQQSAYIETSGAAPDTQGQRTNNLMTKIRSTDPLEAENAQRELLKDIVFGNN